ncbi:MAG: hypothetical protein Q4E47_01690 [Candidatus Saccharibacteria bacterium]|nr:hypothetical protein [Candidatus Saccharibacteria bacterium]
MDKTNTFITLLMEAKAPLANEQKVMITDVITADEFLNLADDWGDVEDWLYDETCWSEVGLMRLADDLAAIVLDKEKGTICRHHYEDLRFILAVFPITEDGSTVLELMDGGMSVGVDIDGESYAEFLSWLYRRELALDPLEDEVVFDYALAIAPEDAVYIFLENCEYETATEIMLNLARSGVYDFMGDLYFDIVTQISAELSTKVMMILNDNLHRAEDDAELVWDELCDAYAIIDQLEKTAEAETPENPEGPDVEEQPGDDEPGGEQ